MHDDRPHVLWVHDLRPPPHLQDIVGELRSQQRELRSLGRSNDGARLQPDQVGVGNDPVVGREAAVVSQLQEIAPVLGIQHQAEVTGLERAHSMADKAALRRVSSIAMTMTQMVTLTNCWLRIAP